MKLWVHRLSIDESGNPKGPIEFDDVRSGLATVARQILRSPKEELAEDPSGARQFLGEELIERGHLRQGWGTPGLDLRRESRFLDNFVVAMRRYWNSIPDDVLDALRKEEVWADSAGLFALLERFYKEAAGRYAILSRMIRMSRGDVVFIPNVPTPNAEFLVATIDDVGYEFDERTSASATCSWQRDFGHRRTVHRVECLVYGPATLPTGVFRAPYRHAIDPVTARHEQFRTFLHEHYE